MIPKSGSLAALIRGILDVEERIEDLAWLTASLIGSVDAHKKLAGLLGMPRPSLTYKPGNTVRREESKKEREREKKKSERERERYA